MHFFSASYVHLLTEQPNWAPLWVLDGLFGVGAVWLYLVAPHLQSIVLHFNQFVLVSILVLLVKCSFFPILIWQKWAKNWTKVMFCGNLVPTKVMIKRDWKPVHLKIHACQIVWKLSKVGQKFYCKIEKVFISTSSYRDQLWAVSGLLHTVLYPPRKKRIDT